jgi:hypothetical protein
MLQPNKRLQIRALTAAGSDYGLFTGWITNYSIDPMIGGKVAVIEATDVISRLKNTVITTSLFQDVNPASLFCEVMSKCAVLVRCRSALRFDPVRQIPRAQADEALQQILNFGRYSLYQDGNGTVQLKGRYFGLFDTAVGTLVGGTTGDFWDIKYALDDSQVINKVKVNGSPRKIASASVGTVAFLQEKISIPASSGIGFWLSYLDPNNPVVYAPATSLSAVNSSDYMCNTQSDGLGTDKTSTLSLSATFFGEAAVCSLYNGRTSRCT